MTTVMKIAGFANGTPCPIAGQFLKNFDHEADAGQGYGEFTLDSEAMKFDNVRHALDFWRKVPRCMPLRADGEYNRPLTASTMSFESFVE
jgi:hypothetical protein